jgi:very-long-chain enoyl-CoA reductase
MFEFVSCANYFYEIVAWVTVSVMTNTLAGTCLPAIDRLAMMPMIQLAHVFLALSAGQMTQWAVKKHKQYKREFGAAYPRRKAIFPFVL